ncbi:transporter substrate-binding domain-containing protein [Dolichospermum sp. UHCC 0352]|uniref:transporter substrate-binding domain-containing protein n=1 Tax=Dolichospermum sp. UHCC 0352 TaxID=2590011 RepID=UPI001444C6D7|nr:transporter substrate-binding domain-containing protein [Dolichospermum sp. UHCC 0352]MTJ21699.1 transporter substrate-binding domain-containing protein [Dolichospermum sp. UHCC 0352]
MKLNYLLGDVVIVSILFLSYPGFTQTLNNNTNQVQTEKNLFFGLRIDASPVSYRDRYSKWGGYCNDFLKDLEKWMNKNNPNNKIHIEFKQVSLKKIRFTGYGDDNTPLIGECGPNTITKDRKVELKNKNADFSKSFAWTGAKLLLKNEKKESFYQLEPFKGETIGVYGTTTTTNPLIGSIYTSAKEVKPVDRKNAFDKLNSNEISAYASDEIILEGMLKDLEDQHPGISQQYSIVPYSKPLSHEPYGIIIYNLKQNQDILDKINIFLEQTKAQELRKNNHLDDTQNNFLAELYELNYYESGFLIKIIAVSILLTFLMLLFLNKLTPTIINGKILDVLKKKVNKLELSNKQSDHVVLPILSFVTKIYTIVYNVKNISFYAQNYQNLGDTMSESYQSKYDQRNANNQFVDRAASGSNVTFNQNNYTPEQKQTLAEAATEIQQLLKQLETDNPSATEAEQISHIKDNTTPKFQRRAASALKAGGETAIDEFILDNKYLKVIKSTIKGWVQPDS